MKIKKKQLRKFIESVVGHLFLDGDSVPGVRLVIEHGTAKLNGAGWCRGAVSDVIMKKWKERKS